MSLLLTMIRKFICSNRLNSVAVFYYETFFKFFCYTIKQNKI